LVGRYWEASGAPAYWPWVQSLRAYVREAEPDPCGPNSARGPLISPVLGDDRRTLGRSARARA